MYNGFSISPVDIYPVTIPVLYSPPSQSIPLIQQHREFNGERIETIISSYVSSLYLRLINWNNVYLIKFPSTLISVPSIIYTRSENDSGICINMDLATAKMDIKSNKITFSDPMSFASCVLYGLNKILFQYMKDDQLLSIIFNSMAGFIHSLIIRSYIKDININEITDQDIANMYYLICKLVGSTYLNVSGNLSALCVVSTQRFFMKEDPKTKKKIPTARFLIDELPKDKEITDYQSLFSALDVLDIFPGLNLGDFRTRISKYFSSSLLSSLGNGLDFCAMLSSCTLSSEIFNQRITSIRPASVVGIVKNTQKYILNNTDIKLKPESDIPAGW